MALLFVGCAPAKAACVGIQAFTFDFESGVLAGVAATSGVENPSFLVAAPSGRHLYAVSETDDGSVVSFDILSARGELRTTAQQASFGRDPCHLSLGGGLLCTSNYSSGSIAAFPISDAGCVGAASSRFEYVGRGPHPTRQEAPHAHSCTIDPSGRVAVVADLGTDALKLYSFVTGEGGLPSLVPHPGQPNVALAPGSGPRHAAFHPDGSKLYVINELGNSISGYEWLPPAIGGELPTVGRLLTSVATLPAEWAAVAGNESTCADLHFHPSGRFLYGSNRGHDSIVVCAVAADGTLTVAGWESVRGKTPRNFSLDASGRWLLCANKDTDNLVVFAVHEDTGLLTFRSEVTGVLKPVCIAFAPVKA